MTIINPIPVMIPGFQPITPVTPFTYRDGLTYLEVLEDFREYIKNVLVPWIDTSLDIEQDSITGILNDLIEQFNAAVTAMLNGSVVFSDPVITAIVEDITSDFRDALDSIYASKASVTAIQGDVTAIQGDVTTIQGDVTTIQGYVTTIQSDVTDIQDNVTDLEMLTTTGRLSETTLSEYITQTIEESPEMEAAVESALAGAGIVTSDAPGYDVFLVIGQSNAAGRGDDAADKNLNPVDSRIMQFGAASATNYPTVISLATDPLSHRESFTGSGKITGVGPAMEFARWWLTFARPNRRLLLVPAAYGGTPLSSNATLGWRVGVSGGLLSLAMTQLSAALSAAGSNARLRAVFWLQGETDGDNGTLGSTYQADFDALIGSIRATYPNVPFIIGQMVPEYLTTGTRQQINDVQADTPNRWERVVFVTSPTGMNLGDGNHFNASGARTIGRKWYEALRSLEQSDSPTSPPNTPAPVTVTATTMGTATFTWTPVAGADDYIPAYSIDGVIWNNLDSTSGLSATVKGLTEATTYQFAVTARNGNGNSPRSSATPATTAAAIIDTFTRADSAVTMGNTPNGQAWVPLSGTWGISSDTAYCPTGTGSNFLAVVDSGSGDQTVSAKFVGLSASNSHSRVVVRAVDASNYWFAQLRMTAGVPGAYQLYKMIAGTPAKVGDDSAVTGAVGDVLTVSAHGDQIIVQVNGVTQITATDAALSTATKHGIGTASAGVAVKFDDFAVHA